MGKCAVYPNPHYVPLWNEEEHQRFLKWAFEYYCSKAPNPRPPASRGWREPPFVPPPLQEEVIEYLYRLGRDLLVLRFSYREFRNWIRKAPSYRYSFAWRRVKAPFRHRQKYQRKPHHEKKQADPVRNDWRARKGFEKDYRKSKWKRSAPRWAHQISARARRRWERQQTKKANWEDLASGDFLRFIDPWVWD